MPDSCLTLPVLSGSMMPYLRPGGRVLVECAAAGRCNLGDIIVFRNADKLVAHRLLFRLRVGNRRYLYQKGDAAGTGYWVREDQMVGVVTTSVAADGTHVYRRGEHCQALLNTICTHLFRDLLARLRSLPRRLARYSGNQRK